MSLHTPVFPPTDPPDERTPSSSQSSIEPHKQQRGLSYSSRLSQWHLAIAPLPYELCPPPVPSSPGSHERTEKLQAEIEKAVREVRNITDFCKLRSTKLGSATKQPAHSGSDQGDGIPWILAETEEEWLEWERKRAQQRSRQKGKDRANLPPPPNTLSQNAHDKVLNWKAGLLPSSPSPVTVSPAPSGTTGRSSLGFPVVKRSTVAKDTKLKTKSVTSLDATSRLRFEARNDGEQNPTLRADGRASNCGCTDTGGVERVKSPSDSTHVPPKPPSEAKGASNGVRHDLDDFVAFPPPSFPADLITSTQKGTSESMNASAAPLPAAPLELQKPTSTRIEITNATTLTVQETGRDKVSTGNQIANILSTVEASMREVPQPTPPSPPYSSETSQQLIEEPDARPNAEIIHIPATPPREDVQVLRPLTPPPDVQKVALEPGNELVSSGMQVEMQVESSPRTPERVRTRVPPSELEKNPVDAPRGAAVRTGIYAEAGVGGFSIANAHITPEAAINGATIARGIAYPRTPERSRQQPLTDPLTTSRKKRPRPRPPSRKRSEQNMDVDADGAASEAGVGDPSPAKSERSYFSSPASGSSSGSDFSRGSMLFAPGSPTSPLGGFTQDPARFAPLAQSTQVSKVPLEPGSPLASRSKLHSHSQTQLQSQNQKESQNQKQSLPRNRSQSNKYSTDGMSYNYNSQFDVEARVDQLSNFMQQDVDLDAWVRSTDTEGEADDEDEDVVAVEEMTRPLPPTAGSLSS